MLDEAVGQAKRTDLEAGIQCPAFGQQLQHMRAEAADRAFLDQNQNLVLAGEPHDQVLVERLGKARVGNRSRQAGCVQFVRRQQAFAQTAAKRQESDLGPLADHAALADLQNLSALRQVDADTLATRVAEGDRTLVIGGGRRHHVAQFRFVAGRHHHETRQAGEIGRVETASMGRAIGADQTGAVDRKADRQPLDGDIVHHLVVAALQEGRIDRAERLVAFRRHAGGEGHGMLFCDADIEGPLREGLAEEIQARPVGHGRRDCDDPLVVPRFLDKAFGKHACVARRIGLGLGLLAGDDVELGNAVILVSRVLRRRVALALAGDDVDQHRALMGVAHILQHGQQMVEIMAVDRADIVEAELLEHRPAGPEAPGVFLGPCGLLLEVTRQHLGQLLCGIAQGEVGPPGDETRQIGTHRADRRGDGHVVVVENDDQARVLGTRIVHRLVGHAGGHGAVADHRDDVVVAPLEIPRDGHAEPRGNRRRGVRSAEGVVFALGALGEAGQTAALAQGADAVPPTRQNLVRIALMADIPDQPVVRRVEDVMDRRRQLDHAEPCPEVSARHRDGVDHFRPQLVCKLAQVALRKLAKVARRTDGVEQRRFGAFVHGCDPRGSTRDTGGRSAPDRVAAMPVNTTMFT